MNYTTTVEIHSSGTIPLNYNTTVVLSESNSILLSESTIVVSSGTIGPTGPAGPAGPAGPGGGSANFELDQISAANPWVLSHNFGWKPNIQVLDTSGEEMIGYIRTDAVDMNTTTLTWELLISGKALAS